ncbi:unnamed protein product, partial [Urochloa humidicola]
PPAPAARCLAGGHHGLHGAPIPSQCAAPILYTCAAPPPPPPGRILVGFPPHERLRADRPRPSALDLRRQPSALEAALGTPRGVGDSRRRSGARRRRGELGEGEPCGEEAGRDPEAQGHPPPSPLSKPEAMMRRTSGVLAPPLQVSGQVSCSALDLEGGSSNVDVVIE